MLGWLGIAFGLLVMLSIWGLMALVVFGSTQAPQTFPLSFRREPDDSLIHPNEWAQVAAQIGFRRGRSLPMHLRIAVESVMGERGWGETDITEVMYRRVHGGTFVLCNYRREARHSSDNANWIEVRHETLSRLWRSPGESHYRVPSVWYVAAATCSSSDGGRSGRSRRNPE